MTVVWAVPATVWPIGAGVWAYRVVPQEFSEAVVSNLLRIGSFTARDKVRAPRDVLSIDKMGSYYSDKSETRYLEMLPTLGYLKSYNARAVAAATSAVKDVPEAVTGVPSEAETTRLGLEYLHLLGIDVSQIARKRGTCDLDLHWQKATRAWVDQKTGKRVDQIQSYGVLFTRRIDGIEVSGFGDVFVSFGNRAEVFELETSWRNLKPYELFSNLVSPEEIVKSIQGGQISLPRVTGWPLAQIRTLTITNAVPRYVRKPGEEAMDFVMPVLELDATISNGKANQSIWFQTGILDERKSEKSSPSSVPR